MARTDTRHFLFTVLGTDTHYDRRHNPNYYPRNGELLSHIHNQTKEGCGKVFNGPKTTGGNVYKIIADIVLEALKQIALGKTNFDFIAHSRGAVESILVAHELQYIKVLAEAGKLTVENYLNINDLIDTGEIHLDASCKRPKNTATSVNTFGIRKELKNSILRNSFTDAFAKIQAEKIDLSDVKITSMGLLDPVPGGNIGYLPVGWQDERFYVVPEIVTNVTALYAHDERTRGFTPIVPRAIKPTTTVSTQVLRGNHGTASGNPHTQELPGNKKRHKLEDEVGDAIYVTSASLLLDPLLKAQLICENAAHSAFCCHGDEQIHKYIAMNPIEKAQFIQKQYEIMGSADFSVLKERNYPVLGKTHAPKIYRKDRDNDRPRRVHYKTYKGKQSLEFLPGYGRGYINTHEKNIDAQDIFIDALNATLTEVCILSREEIIPEVNTLIRRYTYLLYPYANQQDTTSWVIQVINTVFSHDCYKILHLTTDEESAIKVLIANEYGKIQAIQLESDEDTETGVSEDSDTDEEDRFICVNPNDLDENKGTDNPLTRAYDYTYEAKPGQNRLAQFVGWDSMRPIQSTLSLPISIIQGILKLPLELAPRYIEEKCIQARSLVSHRPKQSSLKQFVNGLSYAIELPTKAFRILARTITSPATSLHKANLTCQSWTKKHGLLGTIAGGFLMAASCLLSITGITAAVGATAGFALPALGVSIPSAITTAIGSHAAFTGTVASTLGVSTAVAPIAGTVGFTAATSTITELVRSVFRQKNHKEQKHAPTARTAAMPTQNDPVRTAENVQLQRANPKPIRSTQRKTKPIMTRTKSSSSLFAKHKSESSTDDIKQPHIRRSKSSPCLFTQSDSSDPILTPSLEASHSM
jgi:hypothetical protein